MKIQSVSTDETGAVQFDLSDGGYMFRADYLGYKFWTDICTVPDMSSDVLGLAHTDVTISVNEVYGADSDPISGVKVYLFTAAGSYQSVSTTTDTQGQVSFSLPNQDYKVRADYLGQQFWSETINGLSEAAVDIAHGYADIHVTDLGADVSGASVYLFTETGSYLSRMQTTDSDGSVSFLIPAGAYKFRVDYDGSQYWSDEVNVLADEATAVNMALDLLTLDDTLNPHPRRFDGAPPQYKNEPVYLASLLNITGILTNTAIVGSTANDVVYYFINDHLGTPQKMIDAQGNVVWAADIKPFGEAAVSTEAVMNHFRFAGQYLDGETGLHYNYHRYYYPSMGRYQRTDPIGLARGINLYLYGLNNPTISVDPTGLETKFNLKTVGGAFFFSGQLGRATAKTDCVDGKYYEAEYLVVGVGGTLGIELPAVYKLYGLLFHNHKSILDGSSFSLQDNYPPAYASYLDIEGHRMSFLYSGVLGDIEISAYEGGRKDIRALTHEYTGGVELQIFKLEGVHLVRYGKPKEKCCGQ